MQYLLDPPLLIGEPGYYLTTLASSIILLKSLNFDKPQHILPTVGHLQSMLQIHFTDPDMQVNTPYYKCFTKMLNMLISDMLNMRIFKAGNLLNLTFHFYAACRLNGGLLNRCFKMMYINCR